jgi:hypothetical protein
VLHKKILFKYNANLQILLFLRNKICDAMEESKNKTFIVDSESSLYVTVGEDPDNAQKEENIFWKKVGTRTQFIIVISFICIIAGSIAVKTCGNAKEEVKNVKEIQFKRPIVR